MASNLSLLARGGVGWGGADGPCQRVCPACADHPCINLMLRLPPSRFATGRHFQKGLANEGCPDLLGLRGMP